MGRFVSASWGNVGKTLKFPKRAPPSLTPANPSSASDLAHNSSQYAFFIGKPHSNLKLKLQHLQPCSTHNACPTKHLRVGFHALISPPTVSFLTLPTLQACHYQLLTMMLSHRRRPFLFTALFGGSALFIGLRWRAVLQRSEAAKKAASKDVNYSVAPGRSGMMKFSEL
jgi:hypothetical protein